jgi:hypothetical protein
MPTPVSAALTGPYMIVYLAGTGGRVVVPDATEMLAGDDNQTVHFVDKDGAILVSFQRPDVIIVEREGKLEPEAPPIT